MQKNISQSLDRSDYQCPQCSSMCQVRNISLQEQKVSFFLKFDQGIQIFEGKQISMQDVIGDVNCPTCPTETCVQLSNNKISIFYDCKKSRVCSDVLNVPFEDQKPIVMLLGGDGIHCYARTTSRDYEK